MVPRWARVGLRRCHSSVLTVLGSLQNFVDSFSRRSSSYTAYLEPLLEADTTSIDVLIETTVTKLVNTNVNNSTPAFNALACVTNGTGQLDYEFSCYNLIEP